MVLSVGFGSVPAILAVIPALDATVGETGMRVTVVMYFIGQFLVYAGFAYAVWKYRVFRGELVLPMCHRGVLDGFVLVGSKRRRESYRPDELEALAGVDSMRAALVNVTTLFC